MDDSDEEDYEEPFEPSDYTQLKGDVLASAQVLAKMTKLSPQSIRGFLVNDLYPMLVRVMDVTETYVMDLHGRLLEIEEGGVEGGGLSEESAQRLMEFLGRTSNLFQFLIQWASQNNIPLPGEMLDEMQQLTVQLPGLFVIVQEAMESQEEYEDDEESEEEGDVDEDDMIEPVSAAPDGTEVPIDAPTDVTGPAPAEADPAPVPPVEEAKPEEPAQAETPVETPVETASEEAKPEEPAS